MTILPAINSLSSLREERVKVTLRDALASGSGSSG